MFKGKNIRYHTSKLTGKTWFSAVDVCAAIRGVDYQRARGYWKWLKTKLYRPPNGILSGYWQMKMEAADGKLRMTDVVDAEGVIRLINACPSPQAAPFKLWISELDAAGVDTNRLMSGSVAGAKHKTGDRVYLITRYELYNRQNEPVYAVYPVTPKLLWQAGHKRRMA